MMEDKAVVSSKLNTLQTGQSVTPKVYEFPATIKQFRRQFSSLYLQEQFAQALELTSSFIANNNSDKQFILEAKQAYEQLGERESVLKTIAMLLSLDPHNQALSAERDSYAIDPQAIIENNPLPVADEDYSPSYPIPEDADIAEFLNLFAGRENVYARQWANSSGKHGYTPVNEPMNYKVVKNHLLGNYTVGAYQLDTQNLVKWIAVDLDVRKEFLDKLAEKDFREWVFRSMRDIYAELKGILAPLEIPCYLEYSGAKGYHIWFFLEDKISAANARKFAAGLTAKIETIPNEIGMEIFPKQSTASVLGNLIKLPLGIHRVSGKRSYLFDDDMNPAYEHSILRKLKRVSLTNLVEAINLWNRENPQPFPIKKDYEQQEKEQLSAVPEVIKPPCFDLSGHQEFNWLLTKCPTIAAVVSRIEETGQITNPERKVITYTLGNLKNGNYVVNELLKKVTDLPAEYLLKNPLRSNVTSCQRIRSSLSPIIDPDNCSCHFPNVLNSYPHPLLHLKELEDTAKTNNDANQLQFKKLIESFIKTKKEFNEIEKNLSYLEEKLRLYFENAGVDEVTTSFGKIVQDKESGSFIIKL